METQTLPLVPFGKYKGQPITILLNDTKYLEWCRQQEWFQKFPIVYNICVNQSIVTTNQNSKTPEHNKLQNLFLHHENVEKLLKKIFIKKTSKDINITTGKITFEGMFNWDLIVDKYEWYLCECDFEKKEECDCEIYKKFNKQYKIPEDFHSFLKFNELYCEIKPCLGDDYPCVLRKMKTQIELTNNYAEKYNEDIKKSYEKDYKEDWEMRKYFNTHKGMYDFSLNHEYIKPVYILIIKDFNSTTTTKEQLITIFNQTSIKIVFIDELINDSQKKIIMEQVEDKLMISFNEKELLEPNSIPITVNLLEIQEKLLQTEEKNKKLEEKIKQLEEEIQLLKTHKQNKSIKDYFGKK